MEQRYQGRWAAHMIADHCWELMNYCVGIKLSQQSKKMKFLPGAE